MWINIIDLPLIYSQVNISLMVFVIKRVYYKPKNYCLKIFKDYSINQSKKVKVMEKMSMNLLR